MSGWGGSGWGGSSWWGNGSEMGSSDAKWGADWKSQGARWWESPMAETDIAKPCHDAGDATVSAATLAPSADSKPNDARQDDATWSGMRGRTATPQQQQQQQQQQGARKRAQSSPPTPVVPPRQDKWWLGVDSETRRKYTEEMREWLTGIHSSFSKYFSIIEENYDTVDQICRLYVVDASKPHAERQVKYVDSLFFTDNQVNDPEHQRLFKQWFAKRMGVQFMDDEVGTATEQAKQTHDALSPSAPKDIAEEAAPAASQKTWQASSGWGTWSAGSWNGGNSWWQKASAKGGADGSPVKDAAGLYPNNLHSWTSSGWGEWGSNDRWK